LTHCPFVQIINVKVHQVRRRFRRIVRLHVLIIDSRVSAGTLTQTAAYIPRSINMTFDGEQLEIYARMFQHRVPRETRQSVIMRGIETITFDLSQKFSKMSANNETSVLRYRSLYSPKVLTANCCQLVRIAVHGVRIVALGYSVADQGTVKQFARQ